MNVNLLKLYKDRLALTHAEKILSENSETGGIARNIRKIVNFLEEIETDLEMAGESIVELDMNRLDAIKERNNALVYKKSNLDE